MHDSEISCTWYGEISPGKQISAWKRWRQNFYLGISNSKYTLVVLLKTNISSDIVIKNIEQWGLHEEKQRTKTSRCPRPGCSPETLISCWNFYKECRRNRRTHTLIPMGMASRALLRRIYATYEFESHKKNLGDTNSKPPQKTVNHLFFFDHETKGRDCLQHEGAEWPVVASPVKIEKK